MLSSNTNFDAKHNLSQKAPMYLIHFDGETTDYTNHTPASASNTCKRYLVNITGIGQEITPEEGKSSVSSAVVTILDYNNEITALLATDTAYFHRKKTTIKAGYRGMAESDMLTIMTGWVTGIKLTSDGTSYVFDITDPQKWMQRKVFRGSETTAAVVSGNPINILLRVLTSTGAGTNGDYDNLPETDGLGIDTDYINITAIENVRDKWFPGDSHYMRFNITERIKAIEFFEQEIFQPLNIYPAIDGMGRFSIKPFKPPLPTTTPVQSFSDDNVIGLPSWDMNLKDLINEVEIFYDHDGSDYLSELFYVQSTSINARGPGRKPISIKSKGFHSNTEHGSIVDVLERRKNSIFFRYAVPPLRISFSTMFSRWLSEVGDIVPVTSGKLPNIEAGTRGFTASRMEIISKSVDWKKGTVNFDLLDTGFAKGAYGVISPAAVVVSGTSGTEFTISTGDTTKFAVGDEIEVFDSAMRSKAASVTILTRNTATGVLTTDNIGSTPAAGWIIQYAKRSVCNTAQQLFAFMIGTASNPITP